MAAIGIGAKRRIGVSLGSRIDLLTQLLGVVDLYTEPKEASIQKSRHRAICPAHPDVGGRKSSLHNLAKCALIECFCFRLVANPVKS
jgi:hypothetical protein